MSMERPPPMTQDQKLDEALKETFPASDAFYVAPAGTERPPDVAISAKKEPAPG